ncbi:MAG TPA: amidohydrolase family protein [Streptosporangiaceae bacterium]|jgi:predicted TIM-barrel fold metal-dependent hydrolase
MPEPLPPAAVDTHCHVLDPSRGRVPGAAYDLFTATAADHQAHLAALGAGRGVLVTASAHGTDNEPVLRALGTRPEALRGVAVVAADVPDAELDRLHAHGFRALRLQDRMAGGAPLSALVPMSHRVARLGWHIEIWTDVRDHLSWLPAAVRESAVPVVFDHMGFLDADVPAGDPAVSLMVDLAAEDRAWITLSGSYRLAPALAPADAAKALRPRIARFLDAVPTRLLWGSDWPYVAPPRTPPSTDDLRAELDVWTTDAHLRDLLLVRNPATCYAF